MSESMLPTNNMENATRIITLRKNYETVFFYIFCKFMGISGKTGQSKSVLKKLIDEVGLYNYLCPHNNIMSSKEIFR